MMKINKKILLILIAFLLIGSSFVQAAEDDITLTYWEHQFPQYVEWTKEAIEEYEELNPNIKIEFTVDHAHEKLMPSMFAGTGPDISVPHGPKVTKLMMEDYLSSVNLDAFPGIDSYDELRESYFPNALSPFTEEGTVYGLPITIVPPALILNENLFRKADIDPTNPENIPETWEDVGKIGGEIFEKIGRDEDGNIVYEGWDWAYNSRISWRRQDVRTLMAHYGAKFVNDDGEVVVDSPEAIKAIQTMKDMIHKHKTGDPNSLPGAEGRDWQIHNGFMALGRFPGGELTNMVAPEDTKDQLKVYPFPKPADRDKVVTIRSHTFMVNGSISEKKQLEAWKFINFLTTKKFKTLVGSMGQISARMMVPEFDKPWFETEWFENKKAELHSLQSQPIEALANGKAVWASGSELYGTEEAVLKADEIADVVAEEMERAIFTNSDVEEGLKRAKARIESILN